MASHDIITNPSETVNDSNLGASEKPLIEESVDVTSDFPVEEKKSKKKQRKKKNKKAVTGFEDFYADSPMGPEEAAEEQELYSKNRLFIDRIEECIQRYRQKRKFDNEQTVMFNKYMFLGGVDSEQRQFTGIASDIEAMARMEDKAELRQATARDFIGGCGSRFYEAGSDDWVVDFEGIAKGFLSRTMSELYQYDSHANEKAAGVVKNFLNYVLMHDVCPEYTDSILAARHICDIAPLELKKAHQLSNLLPGSFHEALAKFFLPTQGTTLVIQEASKLSHEMELALLALSTTPGMENMAKACDSSLLKRAILPTVSEPKEQAYKIIDIRRPKRDEREEYAHKFTELKLTGTHTTETASETGDEDSPVNGPLGILFLGKTYLESGYDNVPCSDSDSDIDDSNPNLDTEQILLEDGLLALCEVGMKIQLTTTKLAFSSPSASFSGDVLRVIISCADIRVKFDKFLPQMLMEKWREPVENGRPAPSVDKSHAEEEEYSGDGDI